MKKIYSVFLLFTLSTTLNAQVISIDFSKSDTVSNMVGFLHSIDINNIGPTLDLISPLKPSYWRTGNLNAAKAGRLNETKSIILLSDFYGYPGVQKWAVERKPYIDTVGFKGFIDNVVTQSGSTPVIYDVWNEPDLEEFWDGSNDDFFKTFKIAHNQIRSKLGDAAEICGPSINRGADTNLIRRFCDYCLSNNIRLDILSLHWLYIDNDKIPVERLSDVLLWCRTNFIENVKYAPLKIKKIVVNEIVNEPMQHNPGFILAHYFYLEKGKANGACKACWDDDYSRPYSNCWENTLDGLLTRDNNRRSSWWATKTYADLSSVRYNVTSSSSPIYSIVGHIGKNPNTIRVLIGYNDQNSTGDLPVSIYLNDLNRLPNFPTNDRIRVTIYKIENSGTNEFATPIPVKINRLNNNTSTIALPTLILKPGEVLYADIISSGNITFQDDEANLFPLVVFPNPSNSEVFVTNIDEKTAFEIEIYNSFGQLVAKSKNTIGINISHLSKGAYYIKLTQKGTSKIEKFIKN